MTILASSNRLACLLPTTLLTGAAPTTSAGDAPPADSIHPATSGNLVVEIPATVFIRRAGQWLTITTNTGRAPAPTDTYYLIEGGHATVADASARARIESGCRQGRPAAHR